MSRPMSLLFLVVFFFFFASLWGFYNAVRPFKIVSSITPKDLGLDYEEVSFVSSDKVTLHGWFIRHKQSQEAKTIIALHGYPADKGNILPVVGFLTEKYNLLLFDFRYLGASGGRYSTVGAEETRDLRSAIEFLKSRGIREIGVWGFSMGAAVALMAAPQLAEVKAVVSDSSYARLDFLAPVLFRLPFLKYPLAWLTQLWARLFLGVDLEKVSPMESAKNLHIPVLIIHSKDDLLIPFQHAALLQEALRNNGKARFWFHEDLFHGQLSPDYQRRVADFFATTL
ncbi:MAG: alpha/beta hydrolase [Candidatus Binatia bacterium]